MAISGWLRALDTLSGLAQMAGRLRRGGDPQAPLTTTTGPGPLGQLETRLAGVVVAALKEAFDRDRARLDLEQAHLEAERQRAEAALKAELRRQATERELAQLRLVAIMAVALWMLSAALAIWLPGLRAGVPRACLGVGWALAIASLGGTFAGWQHISAWSAGAAGSVQHTAIPRQAVASAAPWLLLGALTLTGISLLTAL
jgi:hypothetical protein